MRRDGHHINGWLFSHSYLYRWLTGLSLGNSISPPAGVYKEALAGFRQTTEEQKVKFSVILLPILKPYDQWTGKEKVLARMRPGVAVRTGHHQLRFAA